MEQKLKAPKLYAKLLKARKQFGESRVAGIRSIHNRDRKRIALLESQLRATGYSAFEIDKAFDN